MTENLHNVPKALGSLVEKARNRYGYQAQQIEHWKLTQAKDWAQRQKLTGLEERFLALLRARKDVNKNNLSDSLELTESYLKAQAGLSITGRVKAALQGQGLENSPAALQGVLGSVEQNFQQHSDQIAQSLQEEFGLSDEQLAEVKRISATVVPIQPTVMEKAQQGIESVGWSLGKIADRFVKSAEAGLIGSTLGTVLDIPAVKRRMDAQVGSPKVLPNWDKFLEEKFNS